MLSKFVEELPEHYISKIMREINSIENCINLGQGNPDMKTPSFITNHMSRTIESGIYSGYPSFSGSEALKLEIINLYKTKFNVHLDMDEVVIVPGGKTALSMIASTILNSNDRVIIPDPYYPDILPVLNSLKVSIDFLPLKKDNFFLPRYSDLQNEIYESARMIYLNYPNNPTGAVANDYVFDEIIRLALKNSFYILHDFAYGEIGFDEITPRSFLSYNRSKDVGVELYTFSKSYNMAGMRIAAVVGNKEIISGIDKILCNFYTGVYGAIQEAAIIGIQEGEEYKKELAKCYEERRNIFLENFCNKDVLAPQSTFYCWIEIPKNFTDSYQFFRHLLYEKKIGVFPGGGFGSEGERYVRISLLDTKENLRLAAKLIGECY
ncbi:aminotransferase class I/II-fold pyridoxal phosphate-dependent enzyme [Rummeliibacillus stabekisii]|uniref:aminotransferase class I/II-fold pyridoxal phosphate-dependent enzyme n=1 Tax=Rummeliibacillus stabekisii TaxID=241244 RepID=UPI002041FE8F|nr:aminotransferase class I/II-fold pyridoxal phosphate-dependent enzyme [Rummeliibacillus stabekisii]MCM3318025.1 aminotransferase class I/II-fold pyridoxal phosphate-dependent enzyme [Rummeliibacillus stabekisii]